jgi:hypothetical protein
MSNFIRIGHHYLNTDNIAYVTVVDAFAEAEVHFNHRRAPLHLDLVDARTLLQHILPPMRGHTVSVVDGVVKDLTSFFNESNLQVVK